MRTHRHRLFPYILFFSLSLALFVLALLLFRIGLTQKWFVSRINKSALQAQEQLHHIGANVSSLLDTISGFPNHDDFQSCLENENEMLFVFKDDSLCYWS